MSKDNWKGFIWYGLRIAFYSMIFVTLLLALFKSPNNSEKGMLKYAIYALSVLWYISTLFTFIISIIHLKIFKKKVMAATSLVISGIQILLVLWVLYMYTQIVI